MRTLILALGFTPLPEVFSKYLCHGLGKIRAHRPPLLLRS